MSASMEFKDHGEPWTIKLYHTIGERKSGAKTKKRGFKQSCLVLYFATERDWESRHLRRNGNTGRCLAQAPATPEARAYKSSKARAHSLRYNGLGRQNAQGFAEDLRTLGYDETTIQRFLEAAKPHWPLELLASPELYGRIYDRTAT